MALDKSGRAHISYFDKTRQTLEYATNASGGWVTEDVEATSGWGAIYTSIAADNEGMVHIAYFDRDRKQLKYAARKSGTWVKEIIDTSGMEKI